MFPRPVGIWFRDGTLRRAAVDATGEVDFGSVDSLRQLDDHYELMIGDLATVELEPDPAVILVE